METEVDEQNSKVTGFFQSVFHLFEEMKWQKRLKSRQNLYDITVLYSTWKSQAFVFALLLNLLVAATFPYNTAHFEVSWRVICISYALTAIAVGMAGACWAVWHWRRTKQPVHPRLESLGEEHYSRGMHKALWWRSRAGLDCVQKRS